MTAYLTNGQKFFQKEIIYMPQATDSRSPLMALGPDKKLGLIRDTSIQPFAPKEETIEVPVPKGAIWLDINLSYQPRPGNIYPIHNFKKKVVIH